MNAPVVDLPVLDTIGAGDTFHGAFLSWLVLKEKMSRSNLANLSENDLYDALFFANKAASIVCSRQGADPPTLREVENLKIPGAKTGVKTKAAKKPSAASAPIASANLETVPKQKADAKAASKPEPKPALNSEAKKAAKSTAAKEPAPEAKDPNRNPVSSPPAKPKAEEEKKGGKKK